MRAMMNSKCSFIYISSAQRIPQNPRAWNTTRITVEGERAALASVLQNATPHPTASSRKGWKVKKTRKAWRSRREQKRRERGEKESEKERVYEITSMSVLVEGQYRECPISAVTWKPAAADGLLRLIPAHHHRIAARSLGTSFRIQFLSLCFFFSLCPIPGLVLSCYLFINFMHGCYTKSEN